MALEQARVVNRGPASGPPPPYHQTVTVAGGRPVHTVTQGAYPTQTVAYSYPGQVYYGSHPPQYGKSHRQVYKKLR